MYIALHYLKIMIPKTINQSKLVLTACFIWGSFMYLVGTYTSFFGGSLNLLPVLIAGYILLFAGFHLYERKYWTDIVVDQGLTQLNKELYDTLEIQRKSEEDLSKQLQVVIDELSYVPLKLLLLNMLLDTEKHAKLYQNILSLLSHEQPVPSREDFHKQIDLVRDTLEYHVQIEASMGRQVSEIMDKTNSRMGRELLKTIRDDELAHHTMFDMALRAREFT